MKPILCTCDTCTQDARRESTRVYLESMRQANDAQNRIIEAAKLKREQLGEAG